MDNVTHKLHLTLTQEFTLFYFLIISIVDVEIKVMFHFIYTLHYNGVSGFFDISSTINMVHELNSTLLSC